MPGTWRSGGRPTPSALKVARGVALKHRQAEPQYVRGRPEVPPALALDVAARAHWERLAARLEVAGVLSLAHGEALALLAQALADYGRVREALLGERELVVAVERVYSKTGQLTRERMRENPLLKRSERLTLLINRLLGEFGLTPATQTRIEAKQQAATDGFESFLKAARPRR
jgi:phage terminase small subunit